MSVVMTKKTKKTLLRNIWHFFWDDDSIWSWLVNIIIAFLLIKYIVYPGIGLLLGTPFPIVAVISESMQHTVNNGHLCGEPLNDFKDSFENYWRICGSWYEQPPYHITKEQFRTFPFHNGFNKGDVIILVGAKPENLEIGDVLVYQSSKPQPIIHRIVRKYEEDGRIYFQTKGDHNKASIATNGLNEMKIGEDLIAGKGVLRIPYLGWVKILFVKAVRPLGIVIEQ
jgi:signal peptidase I